jgi:hypothetical protein
MLLAFFFFALLVWDRHIFPDFTAWGVSVFDCFFHRVELPLVSQLLQDERQQSEKSSGLREEREARAS